MANPAPELMVTVVWYCSVFKQEKVQKWYCKEEIYLMIVLKHLQIRLEWYCNVCNLIIIEGLTIICE